MLASIPSPGGNSIDIGPLSLNAYGLMIALGVVAAGFVGAAIGRFAERSILASVVRQVVIVLVACAVTYAIGELFDVNMS